MKQPEVIINFEVYEDSVNFLGISQVTLPDVAFLTQSISGAGLAGNIEAVVSGMMEAMIMSMNFRSHTGSAANLVRPEKHNIDLRVAMQNWDTVAAAREVEADKYVLVVMPRNLKPGNISPASVSDASSEYTVYYYAAYKDGKRLWEIDPVNYICYIYGKDYLAEVRHALGR